MGFTVRENAMRVDSIGGFARIRGGFRQNRKDVYFIRCVGTQAGYETDIRTMDKLWAEGAQKGYYRRLHELPKRMTFEETASYAERYQTWERERRLTGDTWGSETLWQETAEEALSRVETLFLRESGNANETIQKNFLVKLLYWIDRIAGEVFADRDPSQVRKVVYSGELKKQEYLFFYFLTQMGADVLLLCPAGEPELSQGLLLLSGEIRLSERGTARVPEYRTEETASGSGVSQAAISSAGLEASENPGMGAGPAGTGTPSSGSKPRVTIPPRRPGRSGNTAVFPDTSRITAAAAAVSPPVRMPERPVSPAGRMPSAGYPVSGPGPDSAAGGERREKNFEELARLASSVVMISVHNDGGEVFATGSGIMIGTGYILTNFHVVRGGRFYSIRIEDCETVFRTDELIKYHPVLDLALLRMEHSGRPLPIYRGKASLVRGQKVVAIGSPMGLFNSVSDGIIAGFRHIRDTDMIQFTAPISHGSSGGAVLNMQGELIGISTAGFDEGQNLNLAVGYTDILAFAGGFICTGGV